MDAREVVKGEIWSITLQTPVDGSASPTKTTLHVLEGTCEVVGLASPPKETPESSDVCSMPMRADWSCYISAHLKSPVKGEGLMSSRLKWANHEEYERGIAKVWLARTKSEGTTGDAKRVVAGRYVLACVVGNRSVLGSIYAQCGYAEVGCSVSGQWKSASEMAQDFGGLVSRTHTVQVSSKAPAVNLFLPEYAFIL